MLGIVFLRFIGFQYSAYIAGEVRGNVKRGVLIALLGALAIGVFANSVYVDVFSSHLGFRTNVGWGYQYWGGASTPALPLGHPHSMPLLAVITNKSLWPLWAFVSIGGTMFPGCCARCTSTSSAGWGCLGVSIDRCPSGSAASTNGWPHRSTRSSPPSR